MAPNEASSLLASRPNENHSSVLVLLRRYRESHLTKWGYPRGGVWLVRILVDGCAMYIKC